MALVLDKNQQALLEHMRTFPETLQADLVNAAQQVVLLNGGDFFLRVQPTSQLSTYGLRRGDYGGEEFLHLFTPSVQFAYSSTDGREISNNLEGYKVTREQVLQRAKVSLIMDSADQRARGRDTSFQDELIAML